VAEYNGAYKRQARECWKSLVKKIIDTPIAELGLPLLLLVLHKTV
jgi:hypothetical protein